MFCGCSSMLICEGFDLSWRLNKISSGLSHAFAFSYVRLLSNLSTRSEKALFGFWNELKCNSNLSVAGSVAKTVFALNRDLRIEMCICLRCSRSKSGLVKFYVGNVLLKEFTFISPPCFIYIL